MSKTTDIQVRCLHCKNWFRSGIWLGDSETFDTAILFSNQHQCPHCNRMTVCNKENFKATFEDGGFIGSDTIL